MLVLLLSHLAPFLFAPNFLLMMSAPPTYQMPLKVKWILYKVRSDKLNRLHNSYFYLYTHVMVL